MNVEKTLWRNAYVQKLRRTQHRQNQQMLVSVLDILIKIVMTYTV